MRAWTPGGAAVAAPVPSAEWQGDWELIAVLRGARVDLYDEEGKRLRSLQAVPAGGELEAATVTAAAFLRRPPETGELFLATGHADGTLRLWDPAAGRVVALPPSHPGAVTALAADGCRLISAGSVGTLRLDDLCSPE